MIKPSDIIAKAEEVYLLEPGTILAHIRTKTVTEARAVAMYVTRKVTTHSFPEIADAFKRHHTSVIHNHTKIKNIMLNKYGNLTSQIVTSIIEHFIK